MNMRNLLIAALLVNIVAAAVPSSRGTLALEPSYTYITFDNSLSNQTSTISFFSTSMYILARRYYGTSEYVWLERDMTDPSKTTYEKRNYNTKTALFLDGLTVNGMVMNDDELGYIVATDDSTNDLEILEMGLSWTTSASTTTDYLYYISSKKTIPKGVNLKSEKIVKSIDAAPLPGTTTTGKRIIIGGTTSLSTSGVFLSIFNTLYNVTEFVWEEPSSAEEVLRAIEIDPNNDQVLLISDRRSGNPLESSCNLPFGTYASTWYIMVRAFSLTRLTMEWSRVIGHSGYDNTYAGSGVSGNFLLIAFNTKSHQLPVLSKVVDTEFAVLRTETGEGTAQGPSDAVDVTMYLTGNKDSTKALDMVVAGENGIYLLLDVAVGTTAGTVTYAQDSVSYTFSKHSLAIAFFRMNMANPYLPTLKLVDVEAYPVVTGAIVGFVPVKLFLYYPSGNQGYGLPELLLAAHYDPSEKSGLLLYSYSTTSCAATATLPASHNPFATSTGCTAANCNRCLVADPTKCLQCSESATYFLANGFTCTAATCPAGYYASAQVCSPCYATCASCSGPLRTQCTSCPSDRELSLSNECLCSSSLPYSSNGQCVSMCSTGQSGLTTGNTCRDKCPSYTFYSVDYASSTPPVTTGSIDSDTVTNVLEFTAAESCLQLPMPSSLTAVPDDFTVSFWFLPTSATSGATLSVWGFNTFEIVLKFDGANYYAQLILSQASGIPVLVPTLSGPTSALTPYAWNFVSVSVSRTLNGYTALLYIALNAAVTPTSAGSTTSSTTIVYPTYANTLLVGCRGTLNAATGNVDLSKQTNFAGYMSELVYLNRGYGVEMMEQNKHLMYEDCLQVHNNVISYWRFSTFTVSGTNLVLTDGSRYALTKTIPATNNPTKNSGTPSDTLNLEYWETLGNCVDLFYNTEFPEYSLDIRDFTVNDLQKRLNINEPELLARLVKTGDTLLFAFDDCVSGTILLEAGVSLLSDGSLAIENDNPLPKSVRGRHVDICYYSPSSGSKIKLGTTYFPVIPYHVSPAFGASDSTSSSVAFVLTGGDQSVGDVIRMESIDQSVSSAMQDVIEVIEDKVEYEEYMATRKSTGSFTKIDMTLLDPGTYVMTWRPSYMYYSVSDEKAIYKNMFVTWSVQQAPKAKFPLLEGTTDSYKNSVVFKGELFYINLLGPGQADGDQILFCYTGCNYSNRRGSVYQRVNGKYPPVWFGEEAGVHNLIGDARYERLYICWRPAARTSTIVPADDEWETVYDYDRTGVSAYIYINYISDNTNIPEIEATNPSMSEPVLHKDESVWFTLTKCSSSQPKPSMSDTTSGRVEILHLTYSSYDHSTYTNETIWQQKFDTVADASSSFTFGKLHGEDSTCNFTLQDVPYSVMQPGHDYMLVIYTRSFVATAGTYAGTYLLGSQQTGVVPMFKLIFRYQESTFNVKVKSIIPTDKEITVKGTNLGVVSIPGNGFTEVRRLFGVIVNLTATPACSDGDIDASYVVDSLYDDEAEITLTGLELGSCNSSLTLDLKLIKLADYTGSALWSYSSTQQSITVGTVGCASTCKTCSGPTDSDCLTCDADGSYPYLYKDRCVAQCGADLPFAEVVFEQGTYVLSYYVCMASCRDGYYLDTRLGLCLKCNAQCRTCTSGDTASCINCKGTPTSDSSITDNPDYNNTFQEMYMMNGMCMFECPTVNNDFSATGVSVVQADEYSHSCYVTGLPQNSHPITVSIQPIIFPEKVSIKKSIMLRALIDDPTDDMKVLYWVAHPEENTTVSGFTSSDKRTFASYTYANLNSSITSINMNAFNYKGDNDVMRVVVKAETSDSMGFDIIELYGNRPPELSDSNVELTPLGTNFTTDSYFSVTIKEIQDADDYFQLMKFKVLLLPSAYVVPDTVDSTKKDSYSLLAQMSAKTITLYGSTLITPPSSNTVTLENIYIPPLADCPHTIATGVITSNISCYVYVMVEDRFIGISKAKFTINVRETYDKTAGRLPILQSLYGNVSLKVQANSVDWNDVLRIAHTFVAINPNHQTYYMSYSYCARDEQCNGHGKCVTSGGWSQCYCDDGYTGVTCNWGKSELSIERELAKVALLFLNRTILTKFQTYLDYDANYTVGDINMLDQVANVLNGILKNPEVLDGAYLPYVTRLCDYMTRVDIVVGGRLEDYEKANIFSAIDISVKYAYFHLRETIYDFYVLGEARKNGSSSIEAEYSASRMNISDTLMSIRNGLYRLVDAISTAQHPDDDPYSEQFDTFEVFIDAEREEELFEEMGGYLAVQTQSQKGFVKIPQTVLSSVRDRVSYNEEFKIRIVKWFENPYVFSDYHSEVCTSVYNMALLDSNGSALSLSLTEPIVFFLPLTNMTKRFPADAIRCKYFNESNIASVTRLVTRKVNVNLLDISDAEKRAIYPEWDPRLYNTVPLIVETQEYEQQDVTYPEFVDALGIVSYGNVLTPEEYGDLIPCAAYHLSEVAAVAHRKRSTGRENPDITFYYDFDPLERVNMTLGIYTCIIFFIIFAISFAATILVDRVLIPRLEKIIELHRYEYSEKDQEMSQVKELADKSASKIGLLTNKSDEKGSGSDEGNLSGSMEEEVKMEAGADIGLVPKQEPEKRKKGRRKGKVVPKESLDSNEDNIKGTHAEGGLKKRSTMQTSAERQGKGDGKDAGETNITTTQNQTTTQEMTSAPLAATTHPQASQADDSIPDKSFSDVKGSELRRKEKEDRKSDNIFSKEHLDRKEIESFKPLNIYLASNLITNLVLRTNTIYTRPTRCLVLFCHLYFLMFFSAIMISTCTPVLDHPEEIKGIPGLISDNLWTVFMSPVFASILVFIVAGFFKIQESRIYEAKTMGQYKRLYSELTRKMYIRRAFGCTITALCVVGINYYICKFSALYGWKATVQWLWTSLCCFPIDMLAYDGLMALLEWGLYQRFKGLALWIRSVRIIKQADPQE